MVQFLVVRLKQKNFVGNSDTTCRYVCGIMQENYHHPRVFSESTEE